MFYYIIFKYKTRHIILLENNIISIYLYVGIINMSESNKGVDKSGDDNFTFFNIKLGN